MSLSYLLKIENETKGSLPFLTVGDAAGRQVVFNWNEEQYAYCHQPNTEQEAHDLVMLNWTNLRFPWRFCPVSVGHNANTYASQPLAKPASSTQVMRIPPFLRQELYADYPLSDLLMLADNDALTIEGNRDDRDNVMRQLHAYYQGRAWGIEDVRRSRAKIEALELELKEVKSSDPKPVATSPAERMAKARAAKKAKQMEAVH